MSDETESMLQIFRDARALIEDPKRWTTGQNARDAEGEECYPTQTFAVCWCAEGAIIRSSRLSRRNKALDRARIGGARICDVNDGPDGHKRVLARFDEVIVELESELGTTK